MAKDTKQISRLVVSKLSKVLRDTRYSRLPEVYCHKLGQREVGNKNVGGELIGELHCGTIRLYGELHG